MAEKRTRKFLIPVLLAAIGFMLYSYQGAYNHALSWETRTVGELQEFPAMIIEGALMNHEIIGFNYLLKEEYEGGQIRRSLLTDQLLLTSLWVGLCFILAAATKLRRFAFFAVIALLALFINRLNLFEIGLFGISSRVVLLLPFLILMGPLVVFHEYKPNISFPLRFLTLVAVSGLLLLGVSDFTLFTDHLIAHSLFGWTMMALIFLFIVSEEIVFGILYVVTSAKGGKSNHIHFLVLSLLYLGNLSLYYLNKSGLFENSFFLFDPFVLLTITTLVSLWSLKFKAKAMSQYFSDDALYLIVLGLGTVAFLFLGHHMLRGNDGIYQAFDYLILYFHLGIGAFFFLYTIANFVDALIEGYEVHKIIYKERNLPYASARFVGLVAVVAFYLLGAQEPYNLLKGGYYNYLGQTANDERNLLLEKEYYLQAAFLGFNTHYPNYQLAQIAIEEDDTFEAKMRYFNASQRFPSAYSLVNYGNMEREINPNKVQAIYEEALRRQKNGEVENNLGLLLMEKGNYTEAIRIFESAKSSDSWNDAPSVNKWYAINKLSDSDSASVEDDYYSLNFGVKANIISLANPLRTLTFEFDGLNEAPYAHRQAYLLNSCFVFNHDSLESKVRQELGRVAESSFTQKLQLALVFHLYKRGEVNAAFVALDYLIANAPAYEQGKYWDVAAKLALDQRATRLSLDFFDKAIEAKHAPSKLGRLDALAMSGNGSEIPNELLAIIKENPGLTSAANLILEKLEAFDPSTTEPPEETIPILNNLTTEELLSLGEKNAFREEQVIAVVEELDRREVSGGYEMLVSAIQINPYSSSLLKKYCLEALEWNLIEYAEQVLEKLEPIMTREDFERFSAEYEAKKQALEDTTW